MKVKRVNRLWYVAVILLCFACNERSKEDMLPAAKLEAVLYDYHLTQVIVADLPFNQRYKKDLYFNYVYDKHGVTKEELDATLAYYARYPKGLSEIYNALSARIAADIQRIEGEAKPMRVREAIAVVGDSVDLWYDARLIRMAPSSLANNVYTFTIPTDTNFRAGDRIAWRGKALFLQNDIDSLHRYVHLNLKVSYMNDSIVSADTLLYTSGDFRIFVSDTAVVKSIDGEVYLKSEDADERLMLIAPSLIRSRGAAHADSISGGFHSLMKPDKR